MKVDMSPKAVTAHLRMVSQLRNLCLALAKRPAGEHPEKPQRGDQRTNEEQTSKEYGQR